MTEREKVLEGLKCCANGCLGDCPYFKVDECGQLLSKEALELLKEQEAVVRCKDCKHLFDGEHTKSCCDALMEKAGWMKEISVSPDWFCADGKRR